MAESCRLTYRQLAWATEWYLSDENLQAANAVLVVEPAAADEPVLLLAAAVSGRDVVGHRAAAQSSTIRR